MHAASSIVVLAFIAVIRFQSPCLISASYSTILSGMQRHDVLLIYVDSLDDIDFAMAGPVWPVRPKGWPCSTSIWHVRRTEYIEPVRIVRFRGQSHAWSAAYCARIVYIGRVGAKCDIVGLVADETLIRRVRIIDISVGS